MVADPGAAPVVDPGTRRSMQSNRSRDTGPELAIRSLLHRRGLRYRVVARPLPEVRRTADIVFTRAKVAVFVDGCFWHVCPQHYREPASNVGYWREKARRNVERDRETDALLLAAGWTVIRVWEHTDPAAAADQIAQVIAASRTPRTPTACRVDQLP